MTTEVEIQCIEKSNRSNPHERITHVGGVHAGQRWKMPLSAAIADVRNGKYSFWTRGGGKVAKVIVANHLGNAYLKTENDGIVPDNLLSLNSCPI